MRSVRCVEGVVVESVFGSGGNLFYFLRDTRTNMDEDGREEVLLLT